MAEAPSAQTLYGSGLFSTALYEPEGRQAGWSPMARRSRCCWWQRRWWQQRQQKQRAAGWQQRCPRGLRRSLGTQAVVRIGLALSDLAPQLALS
jgi:hypothetical protein